MTLAPENLTSAVSTQEGYVPYPVETAEGMSDYERYHLNNEQLNEIEAGIVSDVNAAGYENRVVTVLISGEDERANFARTYEQRAFDDLGENYDFSKNYKKYEDHSAFLLTVDTEVGAVAHVKRLVIAKTLAEMAESGQTGIEMLDDRMNSDDLNEYADVHEVLEAEGTNVEEIAGRTICVATNLTTKRAPLSREKPYSLISYKGVFNAARTADAEQLFVYQNEAAIKSLGKLGVESHKLAGRDFHLPVSAEGEGEFVIGYDPGYVALVIPNSPHNQAAFENVDAPNPMVANVGRMDVPVLAI